MLRYKLLVGGDDALAGKQRALSVIVCDPRAANGLDDDADLRVRLNNGEILCNKALDLRTGKVADIYDIFDLDLFSRVVGNFYAVLVEHLIDAASDGAEAENCNLYHQYHPI